MLVPDYTQRGLKLAQVTGEGDLLRLVVQLLLQLRDLGLQGSDGGLVLGLDCALHLLQLDLELLVLALHLLPGVLVLLGVAALEVQVCVDLIDLWEEGLVKGGRLGTDPTDPLKTPGPPNLAGPGHAPLSNQEATGLAEVALRPTARARCGAKGVPRQPSPAHLQVGLLQPVVHQLRVALLLLQLLLQLGDASLQAPLLLQRQSSGEAGEE